MFGVGLLWRGVVAGLVVSGSVVVFLLVAPVALAQSDVPDAPTAVAAYSIETQKLEVRWSSSDTSVTSFKVQWKSGSEMFDSSRQVSSSRTASIVNVQSTSAGDRFKVILTGLTDGTEYTVRVIAVNSDGDSDPSSEVTGTPQSTPGQVRDFWEQEVIEIFESSRPWLREAWDHVTAVNASATFSSHLGGAAYQCSINRPTAPKLRQCYATAVAARRSAGNLIYIIVHELAHVYTLANSVTSTPAPLGIAHLYFDDLTSPPGRGGQRCDPIELYADAVVLVHGDLLSSTYWGLCTFTPATPPEEALAVVRSALAGETPSWFADTYNDSNGDPDLERVWADVKAIPDSRRRATVVFQLRNAFGGYCDDQQATASAFSGGVTRNPWKDGGCVPEAPTNAAVTAVGSGKLTVSWQEPYDGGWPIRGYKVQWKSGTQEYSSSRQSLVTRLSYPVLLQTISGLTDDESYTIRVLGYNHNGEGAASETTATPSATDTTAPMLLLARFDEGQSPVRLIWNEALAVSSVPESASFTVNVNGASRVIDRIGVPDGNILKIPFSGAVGVSDSVTVTYTVPTGADARPLKDLAGNSVAGFSNQMVRNDKTQVAITSDPGSDLTYAWRNGYGGQDVIEATVTFSENVVVRGAPYLELEVGGESRRARYHSGSGTTSLVFRYSVTQFETDTDGVAVPSGSIQPAGLLRYVSTDAIAPPHEGLGAQVGHLVDAVRPTLVSADALADGSDIALRWDKDLDEDSVPDPRLGFAVLDSSNNRLTIDSISIEGRTVTLTMSSTISATDQLNVNWAWPYEVYEGVAVDPVADTAGNYGKLTSRPLTVSIKQPNSPPEFPSAEDGTRSVEENTPAGRNIGTPVAAEDADDDRRTYSISGADAALFDVVASSGQLRTKAVLNHEGDSSYSFTMSVHDGKDLYGNSDTTVDNTITVTIDITDVNERPDAVADTATVTEDGDVTIDVLANDSDPEDDISALTIRVTRNPPRGRATVNQPTNPGESPTITYTPNADYNGADNFTYEVRDTASPALSSTAAVSVEVDAVNDPPVFTSPTTSRSVSQSANSGDNVGAPVSATDVDGDTLTHRLFGIDAALFDIGARSGQITVADAVTFNTGDTYTVTVDASDNNGGTASTDVTITVTTGGGGGGDGGGGGGGGVMQPNSPPEFPSGEDGARSVDENTPAGRNIGTPIRAMDADNDRLTYSISGADAALFDVIVSSGQLRTKGALNHEGNSSYAFTMSVHDGKDIYGNSDTTVDNTITVTIDITDVNERPDAVADTATVTEDGDVTIDVLANDSDPEDDISALTIRVTRNPPRGRATVNQPTNPGESPTITYTPNADYNGADNFTYEVRDTASPALSSTAAVSVEVDAVNDPPVFTSPTTSRSVSQSANSGDNVGAPVSATDVDGDTLTHRLFGIDAALFDIGARSGQITVADAVTFNTGDTYTVTVDASDNNGGTASTDVTITVTTGGGGGEDGGGGPVPAVQVQGDAFGAVGADAEFTVAAVELTEFRSVSWAVAGPDGFTSGGGAERLAFAPPTGGTYRVRVTVVTLNRETFTDSATLRVFSDITDHRFTEEILWLAESGITVGCSQEPLEYCPSMSVTRAQMASFLARALDLEAPQQPAGFDDTDTFGGHAANIEALYAADITTGCSSEPLKYCPGLPVTRAQMASFLSRALDLQAPSEPAGFEDVDPSGTHAVNIEALYAADITTGCSSEPLKYCPGQPVTRAQMAAFLYRARELLTTTGNSTAG